MPENDDVTKIMENIKKQNNSSVIDITPENIISLASSQYKEKLSKLDSENLERINDLNFIISKEQNVNSVENNDELEENLIQANSSYDIQTINKIESFKPKLIRKWVLKFRNIIQNEVRFALNPIVDKQIKFNIHITRSVNGLKKTLDNYNIEQNRKINLLAVFTAYNHYLKRDPSISELNQWLHHDYTSDPIYEQIMLIKKSTEARQVLKNDLMLKNIILGDDDICYKKIDGQIFHFKLSDKYYLEPFLIDQLYEPGTTNFLKTILKKGMNVINIGANVGYFTLLAAREVGPQGKVFAFEPFPQTVEILKKNVNSNCYKNIKIIPKAVSDKSEPSYLSLKSDSAHNFVTSSNSEYDSIEIDMTTIDDYFDEDIKIDLLLMDAEGYESKILDGMQNTLKKNPKMKIITEYNPYTLELAGTLGESFLDKIENLGFQIQIITDDKIPQKYIKDDILKIKYPNTTTLFLTKS